MNKPEILRGDVKELEKMLKVWCPDHEKHPEYMIIETEIFDFIEQPFKSEMIKEYFDEFNYIYDKRFNDRIVIMELKNEGVYPKSKLKCIFAPKPQTLSHFITYCKIANIKLTWRE